METDSLSVTQSSQGSRSIAVIRRSLYHHVIQQDPNGSRRTSQHEIILLRTNIQPISRGARVSFGLWILEVKE